MDIKYDDDDDIDYCEDDDDGDIFHPSFRSNVCDVGSGANYLTLARYIYARPSGCWPSHPKLYAQICPCLRSTSSVPVLQVHDCLRNPRKTTFIISTFFFFILRLRKRESRIDS